MAVFGKQNLVFFYNKNLFFFSYFAKAELIMPLLTRNHTVKRPFTIVALADLQREPTSFVSSVKVFFSHEIVKYLFSNRSRGNHTVTQTTDCCRARAAASI
jgi:hypothetical protein